MSNPGTRRDWGEDGFVSDRVWAQAVHAVVKRRLSLRQAAQAFGLQQVVLHRLVRQQTLQQLRHPPPATRPMPGLLPSVNSLSPTSSDEGRFTAPMAANDRYVFPRLNPLALGHSSPTGGPPLPSVTTPMAAVAAMMPPPPVCELTPELSAEVVDVLREQFVQQQYDDYETTDGRFDRLEGYADVDIANVVRAVVSHNGHRALPPEFPPAGWLARFKRENDLVDVDDMVRARSRTASGNNVTEPSQYQQQGRYNRNFELEQQQYELEAQLQQRRQDPSRWAQNRNYRQPAASPPSSSPPQRSPIHRNTSYDWEDVDGTDNEGGAVPRQHQRLHFYQPPSLEPRDGNQFRRSPSAGSSNGRSGHSDSDRKYRQSNLVPAKVWKAAMEDVAIHGMSLRNAAKAHGVHFAALHRRLKKRQQHKVSTPCEPNYIPFEDEAGVVRVIHARAEMGMLLTFTELVDLLKRTALKHRSGLPEDVATALVRKFQTRVEQSVSHLILDWPALPPTALYRLRTSNNEDGKVEMATGAGIDASSVGKNKLPSTVSGSSTETGSLSSSGSGSCSSLSPHPQSVAAFSALRKSPVGSPPTPTLGENSPAAPVSTSDDSEGIPSQPCMMVRL